MIALLSVLILVAGILLYALAASAKVQEIGRAMMWTAMLVVQLELAPHVVKLLG